MAIVVRVDKKKGTTIGKTGGGKNPKGGHYGGKVKPGQTKKY